MPDLPLHPRWQHYRGSKESLQRKSQEAARIAHRIADHVNTLIANNPKEVQTYYFRNIAYALGLTDEQVRSAISNGGFNGRMFRVSNEDREALARFVKPSTPTRSGG